MNKYIIHYPLLTDRKSYLDSMKLSNVEWISNHKKEDFTNVLPTKYIPFQGLWKLKLLNHYDENPEFRLLKPGDMACAENHIEAWRKISDNKMGLILEDDAIFCNNFEDILSEVITIAPTFDVLFIGGAFHHEKVAKTIKIDGHFYKKTHPSTNTICAYILTPKAAHKLYKISNAGYTLPIDFEMNFWFDVLNFNVYHFIPYLVREGTSAGYYKSCQKR